MLNDKKFKKDIENMYRVDKNYDTILNRNIYGNSNSSNYYSKSKSKSRSKEKECHDDLKQIDNKLKSNINKFENSFPEQFDSYSPSLNTKLNTRLLPPNYKQSNNMNNVNNSKILKSNKTSNNLKPKYPVPKNVIRRQDIPANNLNKISSNDNKMKSNMNMNTIQTTPYEIRKLRAVSDSPTKHSSKYDKYMTHKFYSKLPDETESNLNLNASAKPQSNSNSKSYVKIYNRLFPFQIRKNFTTANSPRKNSNSLIYSYEVKKPLPFIKNDIYTPSLIKKSNSHSLLKENEASEDNFPNNEKAVCNTVGSNLNNAQNEKQFQCAYDNKNQTSSITDDCENKLSNNIFQLFYTRLTDIRQIKNITSSSLIKAFIDAFDYIGCNLNSRYKKCCELLKQLQEKINHNTIINSHSSTAGSSAHSNHDSISEQLEHAKKDLKLKEYHIKSYIEKINLVERNAREKEILLNSVNKKYLDMKNKFTALKDESKALKTSNKDLKSELDFLREKEFKMMEVMYLLQKKGISIDEVMKERSEKSEKSDKSILLDKEDFGDSSQIRHQNQNYPYNIDEISNTNDISATTVYFPDKVHQYNTNYIFNNYKVKIPKLDFGNLPGYESHSNNNSEAIKININTNENKPPGDKSQLIITDCQSTSPLNQNQNFIRYNAGNTSNASHVKKTNLNTNKNNFFPAKSSSVNVTNMQYNEFENDGSLNSTNNLLVMDKNKDYYSATVESEDCSYSKNKSMNNSNNMSISKLKDSLKNFSLSNASLNSKLKMKQFTGTVKK